MTRHKRAPVVPAEAPPAGSVDELRRRTKMLAAAMELEGIATWSWNRRDDQVRIEYSARAAEFMRPDEATRPGFMQHVHPDDRARLEAAIEAALAAPGIHRIEFRFSAPDGSERWIGSTLQRYLEPGGQPAGLIGASRDITARKEFFRELADKERQLRALSREIIEAANREQERIGHDLHDGLGQELTGIALMLKALQGQAGRRPRDMQRELGEILRLVNHALGSTRAIARGLSPVAVERGGLAEALRAMVTQAREGSGLKLRLSLKSSSRRGLPSMVALHLYRIAQEAFSNAIRHAGATRVTVSLEEGEESVRLRVADDGAGLPAPADASAGLGLRIMLYRAQLIGAKLELRRPAAGGTAVIVTWRADSGRDRAP